MFTLPNETRQHMVTALKHLELFVNKVNCAILRENIVLAVSKMAKEPLLGVTTSS